MGQTASGASTFGNAAFDDSSSAFTPRGGSRRMSLKHQLLRSFGRDRRNDTFFAGDCSDESGSRATRASAIAAAAAASPIPPSSVVRNNGLLETDGVTRNATIHTHDCVKRDRSCANHLIFDNDGDGGNDVAVFPSAFVIASRRTETESTDSDDDQGRGGGNVERREEQVSKVTASTMSTYSFADDSFEDVPPVEDDRIVIALDEDGAIAKVVSVAFPAKHALNLLLESSSPRKNQNSDGKAAKETPSLLLDLLVGEPQRREIMSACRHASALRAASRFTAGTAPKTLAKVKAKIHSGSSAPAKMKKTVRGDGDNNTRGDRAGCSYTSRDRYELVWRHVLDTHKNGTWEDIDEWNNEDVSASDARVSVEREEVNGGATIPGTKRKKEMEDARKNKKLSFPRPPRHLFGSSFGSFARKTTGSVEGPGVAGRSESIDAHGEDTSTHEKLVTKGNNRSDPGRGGYNCSNVFVRDAMQRQCSASSCSVPEMSSLLRVRASNDGIIDDSPSGHDVVVRGSSRRPGLHHARLTEGVRRNTTRDLIAFASGHMDNGVHFPELELSRSSRIEQDDGSGGNENGSRSRAGRCSKSASRARRCASRTENVSSPGGRDAAAVNRSQNADCDSVHTEARPPARFPAHDAEQEARAQATKPGTSQTRRNQATTERSQQRRRLVHRLRLPAFLEISVFVHFGEPGETYYLVVRDITSLMRTNRIACRIVDVFHTMLLSCLPEHVLQIVLRMLLRKNDDGAAHSPIEQRRDASGSGRGHRFPGAVGADDDPKRCDPAAAGGSMCCSSPNIDVHKVQHQVARSHDNATIVFMDVVGFTSMALTCEPAAVMGFLNDMFSKMDDLVDRFPYVTKIETAGDCYIAAGGLCNGDKTDYSEAAVTSPERELAATAVLAFAVSTFHEVGDMRMPNDERVQLRFGIHSGKVVSGIVGCKAPKFAVFGDAMNTASRMESTGCPGMIHVSADAKANVDRVLHSPDPAFRDKAFVKPPGVAWLPRNEDGFIDVKGRGRMSTFVCDPTAMDSGVTDDAANDSRAIGDGRRNAFRERKKRSTSKKMILEKFSKSALLRASARDSQEQMLDANTPDGDCDGDGASSSLCSTTALDGEARHVRTLF